MRTLTSARDRFDSMVTPDTDTGCHLWTGSTTPGGYGYFYDLRHGGRIYAHRWALIEDRGAALADDEQALHHCDTPSCVNPDHLYAGRPADNVADMHARGRANLSGLALGRVPGKLAGVYRTGAERCGTVSGYNRHLRHGEGTCDECKAAMASYHRERRSGGLSS